MPSAYVLINCDLGSEDAIIREIKGLDGVREVRGTYGVYDIITKVESDNMEAVSYTHLTLPTTPYV